MADDQQSNIPCNCNSAVLCFLPGLLWVLILGELFFLLTRTFVRFYSEKFSGEDFTQKSFWQAATPFITGLWTIFFAIVTQSNATSKSKIIKDLNLVGVRNMFPGMTESAKTSALQKLI
ncbi:MAG: hypothetical protein H6850_04455 [Alphaproteobacteria bacterium]|nr:MAG: hypothetical protein H6850_04455 [Alphaproteobacteria bacterium]